MKKGEHPLEKWKVTMYILWAGQFLVSAGMTMVTPFLPLYIQDMGISDPHKVAIWAGVIFAANFLTSFIFQPIWGKIADRKGRKIMLLRSGFGMAIVIIFMGFSTNVWQLLVLRLLNGMITGFAPAANALMAATAPKERMGYAMGVLHSGAMSGIILGPALGGLLADWVGLRPIFYITGSLLFIASLLSMMTIKENFNKKEAAAQPKSGILGTFMDLTKIPQISILFSITFVIQFVLLSVIPLMPLYIHAIDPSTSLITFYSGLVIATTALANMSSSPYIGKLGDKLGKEKILFTALIGSVFIFFAQGLAQSIWQLLILRFLLGFCTAGIVPTINALIRSYTPKGKEGTAFGYNSSILSLGNMLGPLVAGLLSGIITIRGVFIFVSILLIFNVFLSSRLLHNKKAVSERISGEA